MNSIASPLIYGAQGFWFLSFVLLRLLNKKGTISENLLEEIEIYHISFLVFPGLFLLHIFITVITGFWFAEGRYFLLFFVGSISNFAIMFKIAFREYNMLNADRIIIGGLFLLHILFAILLVKMFGKM